MCKAYDDHILCFVFYCFSTRLFRVFYSEPTGRSAVARPLSLRKGKHDYHVLSTITVFDCISQNHIISERSNMFKKIAKKINGCSNTQALMSFSTYDSALELPNKYGFSNKWAFQIYVKNFYDKFFENNPEYKMYRL